MEVLATCLEEGGEAWNNMKMKGINTMKLDLTNLDSAETESEINRILKNKGSKYCSSSLSSHFIIGYDSR